MPARTNVVELAETVLSRRRDTIGFRRCKRCAWEGPAYLQRCRRCPAILGEQYDRDILIVVPEFARGRLPAQVLQ
jgi:hypothetical protein